MYKFFILLTFGVSSFSQTVAIETAKNALVLQTDKELRLNLAYFGKKLKDATEYENLKAISATYNDGNTNVSNNSYTPAGTWNLFEPALQIKHADGNLSTELKFKGAVTKAIDLNVKETIIELEDPLYKTLVKLYFKTYAAENVVEQWTEVRNGEKGPILLEKYASANLYFTAQEFFLHHYHGSWAREMSPEDTKLTAGIKTLDTKLGTRANLYQPPSFMLSFDQTATETQGKVLLGTLAWSGNFKFDFEKDAYNNLRLIAGINPYESTYTLKENDTFKTPSFIYTYAENGRGEASRNMHSWARKYRILDGQGKRLTLLNNWEATYFDFDETKLTSLFKGAKDLGVDLFLLDDGWFGNKYPRNGDTAGLGDWQENKKKLPNGIGYLVKEASKAGIKFGIWVEPEMVNPKSELYEKHKDWVIRQPNRPETYFRNQLPLDLSNPEVQDFVYGVLDTLFTKNPELAFIKWDCNAVTYNAHSAYLEKNKKPQTHLYVDYVKGFYAVLDRIRAKYPKVPMMLCSGGGGRVDYEALKYFTEYWVSDNTDPLERIYMQWENSYFFPAIAQCNHITDWSKVGIKFRTDVAMMGKMGYDIVVDKLDKNELLFSQKALKDYDRLKPTIWQGDQYRLVSPFENPMASVEFTNVAKDQAVVFNYLTSSRYDQTTLPVTVKLAGLDGSKKYQVKEINLYPGSSPKQKEDLVYSGDYLMTVGIQPHINSRRTSVVLEINAIK